MDLSDGGMIWTIWVWFLLRVGRTLGCVAFTKYNKVLLLLLQGTTALKLRVSIFTTSQDTNR